MLEEAITNFRQRYHGTADEIFLKIDVNPKDDRLTKEEFNAAKLT